MKKFSLFLLSILVFALASCSDLKDDKSLTENGNVNVKIALNNSSRMATSHSDINLSDVEWKIDIKDVNEKIVASTKCAKSEAPSFSFSLPTGTYTILATGTFEEKSAVYASYNKQGVLSGSKKVTVYEETESIVIPVSLGHSGEYNGNLVFDWTFDSCSASNFKAVLTLNSDSSKVYNASTITDECSSDCSMSSRSSSEVKLTAKFNNIPSGYYTLELYEKIASGNQKMIFADTLVEINDRETAYGTAKAYEKNIGTVTVDCDSWDALSSAITDNQNVAANITENMTATSTITITGNVEIVSTREYTISRGAALTAGFFSVSEGGSLTLKVSEATNTLTLDGGENRTDVTNALIETSGTLNIKSGVTLQNNKNKSKTLNGEDGAIAGGGVLVNQGKFTLEGGTIKSCYAEKDGGGINVASGAEFEMKSGSIERNTTGNGGAGIQNYGSITLTGGSITGNIGGSWGGGINNDGSSSSCLINGDVTISGNSSNNGGGISNWGTTTMKAGTITNNTATGTDPNSGGIGSFSGSVTITGGKITGNTSGNLYKTNGEFSIEGYDITENPFTVFSITYVTAYGTLPDSTIASAISGKNYVSNNLPELSATGHTFVGWYSDENYENQVTTDTEVTNNITLYAKWD